MDSLKFGFSVLISLMLAACGGISEPPALRGSLLSAPTVTGRQSVAQLYTGTAHLADVQTLTGAAKCAVTVAQLNYRTAGTQRGEITNASGALLLPSGPGCPAGPYPLIAYARGTQLEKSYTNADPTATETLLLMRFFAAQGYAVVATDYLGYALSDYAWHPYQHSGSEASAVIDSIRAARQAAPLLGLALNGKVMLSGFSQGGHAALAAQRLIERDHAAEFNLVAAVHMAGAYVISKSLVHGASLPQPFVASILPFQITSWQQVYGTVYAKPSDVFNAPYDSQMETLLPTRDVSAYLKKLPTGTPLQIRDALFKPAYLADLTSNPANGTLIAAKKQDLLGWTPKTPTTLCAGKRSPVVNFFNAQMAFDDFKSRGANQVVLVDVDDQILQRHGQLLATDPASYIRDYHGSYELQQCDQVAKAFFEQYQ